MRLTERHPWPFRLCHGDTAPMHLKVLKKNDLFLTQFNNNVYRAMYDAAKQDDIWYVYGIKVGTIEHLLTTLMEQGINPDTLVEN